MCTKAREPGGERPPRDPCGAGGGSSSPSLLALQAQAAGKECHVFLFPINFPHQQPSAFLRPGVRTATGEGWRERQGWLGLGLKGDPREPHPGTPPARPRGPLGRKLAKGGRAQACHSWASLLLPPLPAPPPKKIGSSSQETLTLQRPRPLSSCPRCDAHRGWPSPHLLHSGHLPPGLQRSRVTQEGGEVSGSFPASSSSPSPAAGQNPPPFLGTRMACLALGSCRAHGI